MDALYDDFINTTVYNQDKPICAIQKYITENNINRHDAWGQFLSKLAGGDDVAIYNQNIIELLQATFEIPWPTFIVQIYKFLPYYNIKNILKYDVNNDIFDALFSIKLRSGHKWDLLYYTVEQSRWDLLQYMNRWTSFSITKTSLQYLWTELLKTASNRRDIWVTINKITSLYSRISMPIVDLMIKQKNYMAFYMYINGCIQNKILDSKHSRQFVKRVISTKDTCFLDGLQLGIHAFIWLSQAVASRWYEGYINILMNADIELNEFDEQTIYDLLNKAQKNKTLFEDISRRCPNIYYKWL